MKRPDKPVEIKTANAKNYPIDPDRDYRVSDIQKHLKLRVLPSGTKTWEYDYIHNGKRQKYAMGTLEDLTPPQARDKVMEWETNRKKGRDPFTKAAKGISLNTMKDDYFNHRRVKPHVTATGVKTGLSQKEYKERKSRFERHFEPYAVAQTPLLKLELSVIKRWFNGLVTEKPSEALSCRFLGSHMTSIALEESEELAGAISNKFDAAISKEEVKLCKEAVDESRTKRPLKRQEFKALWNAAENWGDKLEGLLIQFIMATSVRQTHAGRLLKEDIQKKTIDEKPVYFFTAKFKKTVDTVVLSEQAVEIYKAVLAHHKEQAWITEFLFPSQDYTGGKFHGLRLRGMQKDDISRAFTGGSRNKRSKGIRGAAAKQQPSILGVKSKTSVEKEKYGEWKVKPVGLHDIRDTYATEATTIEEAAAFLQNSGTEVTKKAYRQEKLVNKLKLATRKGKVMGDILG